MYMHIHMYTYNIDMFTHTIVYTNATSPHVFVEGDAMTIIYTNIRTYIPNTKLEDI